ncbi:MAG: Maf family protein [Oxalobacter sp.]
MEKQLLPDRIWLASKSPRRQELLTQLGIAFDILQPPEQDIKNRDMVNESIHTGESAYDYVNRLSQEKAVYAWQYLIKAGYPKRPVLSADTTVVIDGRILGKPADQNEARTMIEVLANRTHQVLTGVAVKWQEILLASVQVSEVTFAPLDNTRIEAYIATNEPYDKAGGYGIQGLAGKFIVQIKGSYSSIMGLPLYESAELLRAIGVDIK